MRTGVLVLLVSFSLVIGSGTFAQAPTPSPAPSYFESWYNRVPNTGGPSQLKMLGTWGYFTSLDGAFNNYVPAVGDEVGAFWKNGSTDILVGVTRIKSAMAAARAYSQLDIFGRDSDYPSGLSSGLLNGQSVFYRVYLPSRGAEFPADPNLTFQSGDPFFRHDLAVDLPPTPTPPPTVPPTLTPPPTVPPTATPPPTASPAPSATPTPSLSPTPSAAPTASAPPSPSRTPTPLPPPLPPYLVVDWDDYNGDGRSNLAVYIPETGEWNIREVTEGLVWGGGEWDVPVPGDYDGDGTADLGYFDRLSGEWNVIRTGGDPIFSGVVWGAYGDVPVPGDYNGDGTADLATWRPSDGRWRIRGVTNVWYGQAEGIYPVPGDYNGDGTTDLAMVYPVTGIWYVRGIQNRTWWNSTDAVARPLDYDGDGTTELAFYRPATGYWYIRNLEGSAREFTAKHWGVPARGDIPVVGDFDGDGTADLTTFRPDVNRWWILYSGGPYNYLDYSARSGDFLAVGAASY